MFFNKKQILALCNAAAEGHRNAAQKWLYVHSFLFAEGQKRRLWNITGTGCGATRRCAHESVWLMAGLPITDWIDTCRLGMLTTFFS
jgi:hypothetical protein